jgi:hypothetical protein
MQLKGQVDSYGSNGCTTEVAVAQQFNREVAALSHYIALWVRCILLQARVKAVVQVLRGTDLRGRDRTAAQLSLQAMDSRARERV